MLLCCSCGKSDVSKENTDKSGNEVNVSETTPITDPNVKLITSGSFEIGDNIELGGWLADLLQLTTFFSFVGLEEIIFLEVLDS